MLKYTTEFGHIDELIKRLAVSRYDVSWQLNHNGQSVRRLKACLTAEQQQKRVAALCGKAFAEHAAFIENRYGDVRIWGWLVQPVACSPQLQCQYSYVNGRMMRDKLLNHAIRQAYGGSLSAEQTPAFVLYLELDARQVDVNVHPAKHEVRFHQARLIHDFVVSALSDALSQLVPHANETAAAQPIADDINYQLRQPAAPHYQASSNYASHGAKPAAAYRELPQQSAALAVKRELDYWQQSYPRANSVAAEAAEPEEQQELLVSAPLIMHNRYLLHQYHDSVLVVDLVPTLAAFFANVPQTAVPVLLPQRISINRYQVTKLTQQAQALSSAGFDLLLTDNTLIVRAVPAWLRHSVISHWLEQWLSPDKVTGQDDLIYLLLFMLLTANGLAAAKLLSSVPAVLAAPQYWCSAPLQLDATISALPQVVL